MTPLLVRLPNHLGDACMALPALDLLAENGFTLTLAGRPWGRDLFSAYPWKVFSFSSSRIQALRDTKVGVGLLLTNSFSSALEFKLAGISAIGYARDARSWLLHTAVAVNRSDHMVEYYYRLAQSLTNTSSDTPRDLHLRIGEAASHRGQQLLAAHAVGPKYVVLCPVAIGFHRGKLKAWDGFTRLNAELLADGIQVIAMPGPTESDTVQRVLPGAAVLPESDVATFAAVLASARLVVANDSGAGHLAAAAGTRLISVFGVTDPEKTRPWSTKATLVGSSNGWPSYQAVRTAVNSALRD
ncbi:MAG TPA: glycosyltransferase family 9 protein [Burkholderiaceae bacterium]|nr:glycosyltransferase family 9 protein [Burkholderiaceae bacterium]